MCCYNYVQLRYNYVHTDLISSHNREFYVFKEKKIIDNKKIDRK
jgi:hypothetical protein